MTTAGSLPTLAAADVRRARGPKAAVDPWKPLAAWNEEEVAAAAVGATTTVALLAGAECPFTCTMCDLWRHTLDGPTPVGAIAAQVADVVATVPAAPWIKLYNASNFFDPRAVPVADLPVIARLLADRQRVIVENHPALCRRPAADFARLLAGRLEVAMGLETIHPEILPWLGKRMTAADFAAAAGRLRAWEIDVRAFVLLGLPDLDSAAAAAWCLRSLRFAADSGARHVTIIPTRTGNGTFDRLAAAGRFPPPTAGLLERVLLDALAAPPCVVTVDLWGFERLPGHCPGCMQPRRERLERMQRAQASSPPVSLDCGCRHDA